MRRSILGALVLAIGVFASSLTLATGSAHAATGTFGDTRGDADAKADLTKVDVRYSHERVSVRLHLRDFAGTRDYRNVYEVWIDSSATADERPDYYMALASQELYAGRTKGWDMLPGPYFPGTNTRDPYGGIRVFWSGSRAHNYLDLAVPSKSINNPACVRVAVKVHRWSPRGTSSTDHLISRHRFTPWVTQDRPGPRTRPPMLWPTSDAERRRVLHGTGAAVGIADRSRSEPIGADEHHQQHAAR